MNPWKLSDALEDLQADPWICEESPVWIFIDGVDNAIFEIVSVEAAPREDGKGPVVLRARRISGDVARAYIATSKT